MTTVLLVLGGWFLLSCVLGPLIGKFIATADEE